MTPFPDVDAERTTSVFVQAENDLFPAYELIECPECGGRACRNRGAADGDIACRECRKGKSILKRKANYGSDWEAVREWVLERDNGVCQECGTEVGEMHVHHVENLVWFETTAEAHRPENLQTLCKDCHSFGP